MVWHTAKKIHIWDVEKGELLQTVDAPWGAVNDLKISGDGSKVFCMEWNIHAWDIWTGEVMGEAALNSGLYGDTFLTTDSSRVWVRLPRGVEGWDFGVPNSSSIRHYGEPPNRSHLDFIGGIRQQKSSMPGIEDTITGKVVFQPPSSYATPADVQWDGDRKSVV